MRRGDRVAHFGGKDILRLGHVVADAAERRGDLFTAVDEARRDLIAGLADFGCFLRILGLGCPVQYPRGDPAV